MLLLQDWFRPTVPWRVMFNNWRDHWPRRKPAWRMWNRRWRVWRENPGRRRGSMKSRFNSWRRSRRQKKMLKESSENRSVMGYLSKAKKMYSFLTLIQYKNVFFINDLSLLWSSYTKILASLSVVHNVTSVCLYIKETEWTMYVYHIHVHVNVTYQFINTVLARVVMCLQLVF